MCYNGSMLTIYKPGTCAIGSLLLVIGGALLAFFPGAEFLWFTGGPLGALLILIGGYDVYTAVERGPDNDGGGASR